MIRWSSTPKSAAGRKKACCVHLDRKHHHHQGADHEVRKRGGGRSEAHGDVVGARVLAQSRQHTETYPDRDDDYERKRSKRRRVRDPFADQGGDRLAFVLIGQPEVEMRDVPEVELELLVLRLVQAVLEVEVVPHHSRQLAPTRSVPWAAGCEVHEEESDQDDEEDDRDDPEDSTHDEDG